MIIRFCFECGFSSQSMENFVAHITDVHLQLGNQNQQYKKYKCWCGFQSSYPSQMDRHLRNVDDLLIHYHCSMIGVADGE